MKPATITPLIAYVMRLRQMRLEKDPVAGLVALAGRNCTIVGTTGGSDATGRREIVAGRALVLTLAHDARSGGAVVKCRTILTLPGRPTSAAALNVIHHVDAFKEVPAAGQGASGVILLAAVDAALGVHRLVGRYGDTVGVVGVGSQAEGASGALITAGACRNLAIGADRARDRAPVFGKSALGAGLTLAVGRAAESGLARLARISSVGGLVASAAFLASALLLADKTASGPRDGAWQAGDLTGEVLELVDRAGVALGRAELGRDGTCSTLGALFTPGRVEARQARRAHAKDVLRTIGAALDGVALVLTGPAASREAVLAGLALGRAASREGILGARRALATRAGGASGAGLA